MLPGATTTTTTPTHVIVQRPATPQPGHEHEHEDDSQPGLTALAIAPAMLAVTVSQAIMQAAQLQQPEGAGAAEGGAAIGEQP